MISIHTLSKNDNFTDLIVLSRQFFKEYEAHHKDFFQVDQLTDHDITGYFSSFCDQETRRAFIAEDGERIVGYITVYIRDQEDYWRIKKVGEISGLMVGHDYRRQGVAHLLLEIAQKFFKSFGLQYYTVFTAQENRPGIDFYLHHGLEPLYTTLLGKIEAEDTSRQ